MASTAVARAFTKVNPDYKIRLLEPEMIDDSLELSPPSLLIEGENEDLFERRMEQRMERLEHETVVLKDQVHLLKDHVDVLKGDQTMLHLFLQDGQQLSLRAFVDKILQLFYLAAGVATLGFEEKSRWLFSQAAEDFVDRGGNLVLLGQGSIARNRGTPTMMQRLRAVSKAASKVACHSAKPIQVAYALDKLPSIDPLLHQLFEICFGMTAKDMIETLEVTKSLDPYLTTQFHL